jgi:murein DD-endopeptidase MepM/ murein hydrolase activator NlpD
MAKFSEFMQHPRVAQSSNHQSDSPQSDEDFAEIDAPVDAGMDDELASDIGSDIDHVSLNHEAHAGASSVQNSLTTTQDEIVTQEVTPGSETGSDTEFETASITILDDYPDTVWEDALRTPSLPQRSLHRLFPMTARVGVLGLVAVVMWWTWPRPAEIGLGLGAAWTNDARAEDVSSLAVINPVNVEQNPGVVARVATATPETLFTNIVVVTPTSIQETAGEPSASEEPASDALTEPVILEASALLTDTEDGTITVEVPEAAPVEAMMPALQSEPIAGQSQNVQPEIILIPTATPSPTPQVVAAANSNTIPKVEIIPAVGAKFTPTPEAPTPVPTETEVPTATPPSIGPGRLWSTFAPLPATESDHFWLGNPLQDFASNRFASPSYQFGSTAGNRYRPHHGIDISNPSGTPVQAGVEGTVVHAGLDDPDLLGPYANFYGKAVVIRLDRRLPVAGGEIDVFVLYGHLSEVRTEVGQRVQPADVVGLVGMSGIAIGPHLHVEVRLGANTYDHSVNPYLWLQPAEGNGAVAVRVLTANGRTWAGAKVSIARFEGGQAVWARQIETYLDTENIGPDPLWGENGAMGDVPAGSYYLIANINGENIRAEFTVNAGETTFVEIRTEQ